MHDRSQPSAWSRALLIAVLSTLLVLGGTPVGSRPVRADDLDERAAWTSSERLALGARVLPSAPAVWPGRCWFAWLPR